MPSQTPKLFNVGNRFTGVLGRVEGTKTSSPPVDISSRILGRRTAAVRPIAALNLPTAKLPPARNRGNVPNQFLVIHNVKPAEVHLPHHR